ncbi:unnamed protein product [Caenorhabditis auriculariae]|uniref:Uncharacterized protein n=1 Tax=Caenorhabditis auriculariae TaxID=2777116 RepID=A0A8S1HKS7_9PELO|nr:unnamed protein product [Caenorhabditis auriculariae]
MDGIDFIFILAHSILSLAGIFLNLLLIYIGVHHSPDKIRTYAALILNFAFSDLIICIMNFLIQKRNNVQQSLLTFGAYSLLYSFCYRYYILMRPPPSRRNVLIVLALVYLPCFSQLCLSLFIESPSEEMVKIFDDAFPQYDSRNLTICGIKDNTLLLPKLVITHGIFAVLPLYAIIFIFRYKIVKKMKGVMPVRSETKSMQKQFLKALTYQTLIPIITLFAMFFFGIGHNQMFKHKATEYATPIFLLVTPVVSPLTSLYFVHPYKHKLQSLLSGDRPPQKTISVSTCETSTIR